MESSVAVALNSTIGSFYLIFYGQLSFGAVSSGVYVTSKVHLNFNPLLWFATTFTVVVPTGKEEPDSGFETTVNSLCAFI